MRSLLNSSIKLSVVALLPVVLAANSALAAPLTPSPYVTYTANANPNTQGWTTYVGTACTGTGVTSPATAWYFSDSSTTDSVRASYFPTSTQLGQLAALPWYYSATLEAAPNADSNAVGFWYGIGGSNRYVLSLSSNASGVQTLTALTNPYNWSSGSSVTNLSAGFHSYEMLYDPNSASVSVLVDGTTRITGWKGDGYTADSGVVFGSGSTGGTGSSYWESAQFGVMLPSAPEPATLALMAIGGAVLLRRRFRSRR